MNAINILLLLATFVHGLLAGMCLDVALVKLPTRHRIGIIAYANFARGNDLGNGIIVYPIVAIIGALLLFSTTIVGYVWEQPTGILYPLYIASVSTILVFAGTAKAAPIMLSLKNDRNEEGLLRQKLDVFARWNVFRTVFQVTSFIALTCALAEI